MNCQKHAMGEKENKHMHQGRHGVFMNRSDRTSLRAVNRHFYDPASRNILVAFCCARGVDAS